MRDIRNGDRAGKAGRSVGTQDPKRDAKGLTCNEGQVEALLSEGESTENESREDGQAERPAASKRTAR